MALLHDYLKQQQSQNDVWTIREQLCLTSAVVKNGDQNWVAISRTCQSLTSETNRPPDWYSTKNCAFQYAKLLEKIDNTKTKREKEDGSSNESPGEILTKMLSNQRIEELKAVIVIEKDSYEKLLNHINVLESGEYDHRIDQIWDQIIEEQQRNEEEEKLQEELMKQRCDRLLEMQNPYQIPVQTADRQQKTSTEESSNSADMLPDVPLQSSNNKNTDLESVVKMENKNLEDVAVKSEILESEERVDSQDKTQQSEPQAMEVEPVADVEYEEVLATVMPAIKAKSTYSEKDGLLPEAKESDLEQYSKVRDDSSLQASLNSQATDEIFRPVNPEPFDKIPKKDPNFKTTPLSPVNNSNKTVSIEKNADDIYAFDSDPECTEKKGITSFSLCRDEPKTAEKYETFKRSRKRKRKFKEIEEESTEKGDSHVDAENILKTSHEDHEEFEFPKKLRRNIKKEDDEDSKKKLLDIDEDEISRDSAEVKEILMFVKSDRKRVYGQNDTSSPVISESNPSSPASTYYGDESESEKIYKTWKRSIMLVWNDIAAHKNASVFLRPISQEKLPGYHSIIYKPTDLQTIKRQIETGVIKTTLEFHRQILILFLNAIMYNPKDHNIYQMAQEMTKDCVATIEEFDNTQMSVKSATSPQKSLRRETRESSFAKRNELIVKRKRK